MSSPPAVPAAFVRAHTRIDSPALVPEIRLHVADDVVALWEAMETERVGPAEEPPFWAAAWPGGQALARYVLDHPELVAGRRVLDLGSGSGLVAVAAALAGAGAVVASDPDPYSAAAVAVSTRRRTGWARSPSSGDVLDGEPPDVDVFLAGDVCYDRAMTARVLPFLGRAWLGGATVLLGDPGRPYVPRGGPDRRRRLRRAGHRGPRVGVARRSGGCPETARRDQRHAGNSAAFDCHAPVTAVSLVRSGRSSRPTPGRSAPDAAESPTLRGRRAGDPPQYWGESCPRAPAPGG